MAIRSGFFNSVNGDRKYDANRFAEYFATFIGNGVFPNPSTNLQVMSNNDMTVTLKEGTAWINGWYMKNTDDYILEIDPADGVLSRIDRIVIRLDVALRDVFPSIKKGAFASNPVAPVLQRDADAYELAIADVYVGNGAISITQANITDLRLNTELCGIMHGTVDQVDTTTLFNQYLTWLDEKKTQYNNDMISWTAQKQNEYENWTDTQEQSFEDWRAQEKLNFDSWFESVQDILDENIATTILNMIGDLDDLTTTDKSSLIEAINEVNAKEVDLTPIEQQIEDLDNEVTTHLADFTTFKENTETTIGNETLPTTAKTLKGAIAEVFTNGNNVKSDTVTALLSVDDTLPITVNDSWEDVVNAIGQISTGKKWARGNTLSVHNGKVGTASRETVEVRGLTFSPKYIIVKNYTSEYDHISLYADMLDVGLYKNAAMHLGYSYHEPTKLEYTLYDDGFTVRVSLSNRRYDWVAFE